jgi:Ca-activated chloride channel family protein
MANEAVQGGRGPNDRAVTLRDATGKEFLAVRGLQAQALVDGPLATLRLVVTFHNDLGRTLEGDLVFPLPPMAALRELSVKVGGREIDGRIRPRGRAKLEYQNAVAAGQTAALGETEGEDLARLRIAPIDPGEDVVVELGVTSLLLPVADGHRLIVPLTYMPRFVEDEAKLKDVERAAVERPRPLTLAARAQVEVRVAHVDGKAPALRCTSHGTETKAGARYTTVTVAGVPLDRDLILEIADRPRGSSPTLWIRHDPAAGPDGHGPTTAVAVVPPAFADEGPTIPRTVIFLVDRSGSMGGAPMQSALRAVRGCLRALGPEDRFNVVAFDDRLEALSASPLPFDDAALSAADRFVGTIDARGGTNASMALTAALEARLTGATAMLQQAPPPDSAARLRVVVFMTDGDVAGAEGVLAAAKEKLLDTRIHVLGIGDSVNHGMLAVLARLGGGTYLPVATNEDLEKALARLKNAITAPLWTGIKVLVERDGERKAPRMLEPPGPIDLFAGEPALFAFRGPIEPGDRLVLQGQTVDGKDLRLLAELSVPKDAEAEGAATVWALLRNRRLTYAFDPEDDDTLEGLGTAFGVVNRQVALLGVHKDQRQKPVEGSVPVALPLPRNVATEGMRTQSGLLPPNRSLPPGFGPPPGAPPPPPAFGPPPQARAYAASAAAPSSAPPVPRAPVPASPARAAGPPPAMKARRIAKGTDEEDGAAPKIASAAPAFTKDEAGLRALLLHQKADGLFEGDLGVTLAAVAALVGQGHTAREGLFRAELRRTLVTLRGRLSGLSGDAQVLAALAIALLTMPHGDPAPDGLPSALAAALGGISLSDLPAARQAIKAALAKAPAGWNAGPVAGAIAKAFL